VTKGEEKGERRREKEEGRRERVIVNRPTLRALTIIP
jgi:hypothetical protein